MQIQQVLLNLIINGMESMAEVENPKVLEISTELNGRDEVVLQSVIQWIRIF